MKIGFLITARLKSTRLPKKVILKINGKEIIRYMIERLRKASALDKIIIATSTNPQDDILETIAKEENVGCFRGSDDDVLERLYQAAKEYKLDYILNVTADCPLVSIEYIDKIIKKYKETDADLVRVLDLPTGFYLYGIKMDALKKVLDLKASTDTEVWGRYFTDAGIFKIADLDVPEKHKMQGLRLTLDYKEDFEFLKRVFRDFNYAMSDVSIDDFLDYFRKNPEVKDINFKCEELYRKRWDGQNKIAIKGLSSERGVLL